MSRKIIFSIIFILLSLFNFFILRILVFFDFIGYNQIILWYELVSIFFLAPTIYFLVEHVLGKLKENKENIKSTESVLNESALISKTDERGRIIYVNDKFCEVSGYKRHELLGQDHSLLNSGEHPREFWDNMYLTTTKYKTIWNETVKNRNKNGEIYIVNSWIMAEFDEYSKLKGFLSVRQDLTELYKNFDLVEKKSKEVKNVINAINKSNSVIEFCPNGLVLDANKNFLNLMGYTLDEILGKHHSMFVNEDLEDEFNCEKFWGDIENGIFKTGDFVRVNKKGEDVYIHGTYNPIMEDGKLEKVLKVVTDITQSVHQKIEIERKNSYLEHAAKILRHDMHSGINTYIPRGLKSLKRRLDDKIIKDLKIESPLRLIEEGLSHSQKVYSGVKEFTNLVKKGSKIEKQIYNLNSILKEYLKSTAYSSQVKLFDLGNLEVNESLFCTAIDNLIRNGLKYNDSKTKLVSIQRINNTIQIVDNGRGMSKEEFEEYSKPYNRKKDNKESGSGLGLNICIAIMKEHGFNVSSEKLEPKGTKIIIEL